MVPRIGGLVGTARNAGATPDKPGRSIFQCALVTGGGLERADDDPDAALRRLPSLERLTLDGETWGHENIEILDEIGPLLQLRELTLKTVVVRTAGIKTLQTMPLLRTLKYSAKTTVDASELRTSLPNCEMIDYTFEILDADKNGEISDKEFNSNFLISLFAANSRVPASSRHFRSIAMSSSSSMRRRPPRPSGSARLSRRRFRFPHLAVWHVGRSRTFQPCRQGQKRAKSAEEEFNVASVVV